MKNIYNKPFYRFKRWFRNLLKTFPFSIIGKHLNWVKYSACRICASSTKFNYFIVPNKIWEYFSLNTVGKRNAGVVCFKCFSEFCYENNMPYVFGLTPYWNTYIQMHNYDRGYLDKWVSIMETKTDIMESAVYSQVYGTPEDWKIEEHVNENKKVD